MSPPAPENLEVIGANDFKLALIPNGVGQGDNGFALIICNPSQCGEMRGNHHSSKK